MRRYVRGERVASGGAGTPFRVEHGSYCPVASLKTSSAVSGSSGTNVGRIHFPTSRPIAIRLSLRRLSQANQFRGRPKPHADETIASRPETHLEALNVPNRAVLDPFGVTRFAIGLDCYGVVVEKDYLIFISCHVDVPLRWGLTNVHTCTSGTAPQQHAVLNCGDFDKE
jgi:hypothetical protein